ncbi:glycosyl hydrolase, family 16 [Ectocarpus siliculosus]|uniref:Glycosyl hydrolase, family 16 n=1 Tax=Ectocarpus siliculosus TaxID=2880 RepID=D8LGG7_ECTSI|nr:glycosyl hydrolase, family 16 [Ectocarpus siliculosus]|eukprot:CBN75742.1 glycosyl hydrolase, family 16 [Ectocarpus siliculosus]
MKMKSNWVSTKTMLLLLVCLIPCRLSSVVLVSAASASTASWTTVWVDEFQGEDVDVDKWEFPDSTEEESDPVTVEGGVRREQSDNNTSATENHHRMRSFSNPHLQAYIGADDYLVMVAAAAPPPQNSRGKGNGAEVLVGPGPSKPPPRGRIGTAHSANFVHGRVEISAKVSSRGSSGFWLMPSDAGTVGHTPCARVAIAEIRARQYHAADKSGPDITASLGFGDYEEDRWGCTSSSSWPDKGGGCSLPAEHGVDWSDGFHVYALEWEEDEIRW